MKGADEKEIKQTVNEEDAQNFNVKAGMKLAEDDLKNASGGGDECMIFYTSADICPKCGGYITDTTAMPDSWKCRCKK